MHTPCIDTEKQVDWTTTCCFFERLIKALVTRVGRAPDLVLERLMNIVLGIRFDDEKPRLATDL